MPLLTPDGKEDTESAIRMAATEDGYVLEARLLGGDEPIWFKPEFRMFHPELPVGIGVLGIYIEKDLQFSVPAERVRGIKSKLGYAARECEGGHIFTLTFRRADFGMERGEPFRLIGERRAKGTSLALPDRNFSRLTLGNFSPDSYAFFIPEE